MILYLIKAVACSAIFIAVYHLFLEREKMNQFNRFYLLGTVLLSMLIPLITVEITSDTKLVQTILPPVPQTILPTEALSPVTTGSSTLPAFLTVFYILVAALLFFRFLKNLLTVHRNIRKHNSTVLDNAQLVVLKEPIVPHTFLNHIFINEQDLTNTQILTHELTHFRQRHSLDILFIELVHCVMWFNPFLILYKKSIRLNHEFLADESVLNHHKNVSGYQQLLLNTLTKFNTTGIASSFNHSITKKRFTMMTTMQNKKRSAVKILLAILILGATSAFFSNKVYSQSSDDQGKNVYTYKDGEWKNQQLTVKPEPMGGFSAFVKAFLKQIKYPSPAKIEGVEGDVVITFEVDTTGKLANFSVIKTLHQDCDNEVIRSLTELGIEWKVAELNDQRYASRFVIPVSFRLEPTKTKDSYDLSAVLAQPLPQVVVVTSRVEN